jgi:predicted ATPase
LLKHIHLQNFKASRDVDIRLAPLTVLSGLNSSGKSTLLQALATLRQSYSTDGNTNGLRLSGELLQLGQCRDVLSQSAEGDPPLISIRVVEDDLDCQWISRGEPDYDELPFQTAPSKLPKFITSQDFQFLQANRIVPQTLYPQASHQARDTGFLGPRGEFTVGFLTKAKAQAHKVSARRIAPKAGFGLTFDLFEKVSPTEGLVDQVAGWLQQLSPGVRLEATPLKGTDEVLLQFQYLGQSREAGLTSDKYRPTNVGFGLTYNLPILVACLAAPAGGLLLLENPEAHLHPKGQAALGELISRCASDGVQVLVETHSDHLLNSIRIAVKRKIIRTSDVVFHFFQRSVETGEAFVQSPTLFEDGRLSNWPEGFFDQWDKDVDALLD